MKTARRVPLTLALAGGVLVAGGGISLAYFQATGTGDARATADGLVQAAAPSSAVKLPNPNSNGVRLTVPVSGSKSGRITGYEVRRYSSAAVTTVSGGAGCATPTVTTGTTSCDDSGVPDGEWFYAARQLAGSAWTGAESSGRLPVLVDTTRPTVSLTSPTTLTAGSGGWYTGGTLTATASDANGSANGGKTSGLSSVDVTGGTPASSSASPVTITPQQGSSITVSATATDGFGNKSASTSTIAFKYDSAQPSASFGSSPTEGQTVGGTVSLSGSASDATSGLASSRLSYRPAGGTYVDLTNTGSAATPAASWDTSALADGAYELRLLVIDNAGLSRTAVRSVTVSNAPAATPLTVAFTPSSKPGPTNWDATVSITATSNGVATGGVTISGTWSHNSTPGNCTTGTTGSNLGKCEIKLTNIPNPSTGPSSVTFTATSATGSRTYTVTYSPNNPVTVNR